MTWYALCDGKGLPQCRNCRRNADNQPLDTIGEHQAWMVPQVRNEKCGDWMPIPQVSTEDLL